MARSRKAGKVPFVLLFQNSNNNNKKIPIVRLVYSFRETAEIFLRVYTWVMLLMIPAERYHRGLSERRHLRFGLKKSSFFGRPLFFLILLFAYIFFPIEKPKQAVIFNRLAWSNIHIISGRDPLL